jgi:hypothetical protein
MTVSVQFAEYQLQSATVFAIFPRSKKFLLKCNEAENKRGRINGNSRVFPLIPIDRKPAIQAALAGLAISKSMLRIHDTAVTY